MTRTINTPLSYALTFLFMFVVGSCLSLFGCGCSSAPLAIGPGGPVSRASVVVLVEARLFERTPALASDGEPGSTGAWRTVAYAPTCNAFAIARDGNVYLATAEHCVHDHPEGATVRFLAPSGIGHGFARVTFKDEAHDVALLSTTEPGLVPLPEAAPPHEGAHVTAVSAYYEALSAGTLLGRLSTTYYGTSQTVHRGWSGSPELDAQGRVWGIVSQCPSLRVDAGEGGWDCVPGETIVTVLP